MADVLKVTPEELQATANQFKGYQGNLQTAYLQMSDAVRSLDTSWNGEANSSSLCATGTFSLNHSTTPRNLCFLFI